MRTTRRGFIQKTAAATIATAAFPAYLKASTVPPSDQVNVALIGCRNMGFGILKHHLNLRGVNCVALCDVDQRVLDEKAAEIKRNYKQSPKLYGDFRKLLENKDVDAVIVGTPDHWHCLPTIYALQAGKDVYVEKPLANSITECNLIVQAARRYNKQLVQVGQQQRSGGHWNKIHQLIADGKLGKLRKVNVWGNFNYGIGQPIQADTPVPEGVDFDFWLGPAPKRGFNPARFHGSWRMFWDYGGGLVTDWGVHLLDMAFWPSKTVAPPKTIMATGGNLSFADHAHETFDTMSGIFQLDDYAVTWEHTAGTENGPWDQSYGLAFVGDLGTILADRSGFKVLPEWDNQRKLDKTPPLELDSHGENHAQHVENFVQCIRDRKSPVCSPEIGRAAAIAAHSANIAIRSGAGMLHWDEQTNRFTNSELANSYLTPNYRTPWKLPEI